MYEICETHGRMRCGECRYVEELEETIEKQKHEIERYREYLELIRIIGTHGTNIESREVIMSDEASLADEALEG